MNRSFVSALVQTCGGRGGLMVSVLDSEASGPGLSPSRGHCVVLCCWVRHFTLTVSLSTQVYKWVPANVMLVGNPAMDQHPIQGGQQQQQFFYPINLLTCR